MTNKNEKQDPRRAFVDLLDELRAGDAVIDASESTIKLIAEVRETMRPGKIVISISVSPSGVRKALEYSDEIVIKHPKKDKESTLLFCTEDGLFSKSNPDQAQLPLRDAPPPANVKEMPTQAAVNE